MKVELKKGVNSREIYDYMRNLSFPYHYEVEFNTWEKSYLYDIDGEGRTLFSDLTTIGAYMHFFITLACPVTHDMVSCLKNLDIFTIY